MKSCVILIPSSSGLSSRNAFTQWVITRFFVWVVTWSGTNCFVIVGFRCCALCI